MTGSTVRGADSGLRQHQLAVLTGGVLLLDRAAPLPRVTSAAQLRNLMGCCNAVRFGVPLGTPVLDTLSVACVAIHPLFGMRMRQKILHRFGVTYLAEVTSFLVCRDGRAQRQNEKTDQERLVTAGFWAIQVHLE